MRTVRSRLAIAAPLIAVFAIGLCGVHASSAPAGSPTSVTAARTDDDSGWGRSADAAAAVASPDDNGDSGWG
ncbi:hypothetical protein ACIF8T_32325 [Streptomyces sp. NPDC085946]|uniref:hypothetical protein n=1 Tax=Streptomyces sp. NPDC085946 TaxID=3365744 RepID=UPI0037D30200